RRGIAQILGGSGMMMQENKQKTGSFVLKNECVDELEGFAQVSQYGNKTFEEGKRGWRLWFICGQKILR
ncbi:MAG: hypothetical protein Q4A74_05370, partial [Cardiobacteriaceae bacterium]|nr:hypothetical protein [Cardiobacteriaceae bacterium]